MEEHKEETHSTNLTVHCQNQPFCSWGCVCGMNHHHSCYRNDCDPYIKNPDHYIKHFHVHVIDGLCPEITGIFKCCLGKNHHYLTHKSMMVHRNPHFTSILQQELILRYARRIKQIVNEIEEGFIMPSLLDIITSYSYEC
jgi:hypothetical protein